MKMAQFALIALVAGMAVPVQVGVNAALRRYGGNAIWATLVSFAVGFSLLAVALVATRGGWPEAARFAGAPWWIWTGGLLGASYVFTAVIAGPRLGASAFLACVIAGQLVASVVIDQFGWVGLDVHVATPGRIVGAALLLVGALCVLRY